MLLYSYIATNTLARQKALLVLTDCKKEILMNQLKFALIFFLFSASTATFFFAGCAATGTTNMEPIDLSLLENWSGDYPVSELGRLPAGQLDTMVGYIGDSETFIPIWQVFKPNEDLPAVNFSKNIIVFSRNVQFYNRTSILKVMLKERTAEIFAMETMSALPIEDKVAMAMAVIPRKGIKFIQAGKVKIEVKPTQ